MGTCKVRSCGGEGVGEGGGGWSPNQTALLLSLVPVLLVDLNHPGSDCVLYC